MNLLAEGFVDRQQNVVNDQVTIARMICDVGEFGGMQAEIERMKNAAGSGDAEVGFEVRRSDSTSRWRRGHHGASPASSSARANRRAR